MKRETFHMLIAAAYREGADHWIAGPAAKEFVANQASDYADDLTRRHAASLEANDADTDEENG